MATILLKGKTKIEWTSENPIIANKELVLETNTRKMKIGNGVSKYSELPYTTYKVFTAIVTLGATGLEPSMITLEDSVGVTGISVYESTGVKANMLTSSGKFTANKTAVLVTPHYASGGVYLIEPSIMNTNAVLLNFSALKLVDDFVEKVPVSLAGLKVTVEIKVYE